VHEKAIVANLVCHSLYSLDKGGKMNTNKEIHINAKFDSQTVSLIDSFCEANDLNRSQVVRMAVKKMLISSEKQKPKKK
jgi:hypothetical protein